MELWKKHLTIDPIPSMLASENQALVFFTERDLCNNQTGSIEELWGLPEATKILRRQQPAGFWNYPGKMGSPDSNFDYNQLETFRNLSTLVEKYGFNIHHGAITQAAAFLFTCQSKAGDFRGIYRTQFAPNYSAAIMEILIKAGFESDPRIEKGLQWLLSMRQEDGGWAIPLRTLGMRTADAFEYPKPLLPDRSKPFSHLITGMVLRAFAVHPIYRDHVKIKDTGALLLSRMFQPDKYADRRSSSYWKSVSYPFWWTDIVSSLDTLSRLGFGPDEPKMKEALAWLAGQQYPDGLFNLKLLRSKDKETNRWVCLAICRILRRLYEPNASISQ